MQDKRIWKRMLVMIILVVGFFLLIFAFKFYMGYRFGKAMQANQNPPATVTSAIVSYQAWPQQLRATGSFRAVLGIDVTSEISGLVRAIRFRHGQTVKKNDLLVVLNPDTEKATLHIYQAQASIAKITYNRDKAQYAVHAVSKQQVQNDYANLKVAQSQIEREQSLINKKMIRAPFAGKLGITPVNPGDYINPGNKIVSLQALNPIYVEFTLPQQNLPQLKVGQKIQLTTNVFPNEIFYGKINAINPIVDQTTRNVAVEALLKNPKQKLLPGIFADVLITFGSPQSELTVPITAVSFNSYGQIVYIIQGKKPLRVQQAFVKIGETRGDLVSILSGLKSGDIVVTSGQMKLKNGSPVVIDNRVMPGASPHPNVGNEQL